MSSDTFDDLENDSRVVVFQCFYGKFSPALADGTAGGPSVNLSYPEDWMEEIDESGHTNGNASSVVEGHWVNGTNSQHGLHEAGNTGVVAGVHHANTDDSKQDDGAGTGNTGSGAQDDGADADTGNGANHWNGNASNVMEGRWVNGAYSQQNGLHEASNTGVVAGVPHSNTDDSKQDDVAEKSKMASQIG